MSQTTTQPLSSLAGLEAERVGELHHLAADDTDGYVPRLRRWRAFAHCSGGIQALPAGRAVAFGYSVAFHSFSFPVASWLTSRWLQPNFLAMAL